MNIFLNLKQKYKMKYVDYIQTENQQKMDETNKKK